MGPTGDAYRVIQLHPTRRCNLKCLHCYSSSGPEARDQLSLALVERALTDASAEQYNVAGFSGGEPTMYPSLPAALAHAHAVGMRTTVTSNGMLLSERILDRLRPHLDLLAISLDGVPSSHNEMRGAANAFDMMVRHLPAVRGSEVPFGFIFTLTQHNLHELDWVAQFAVNQGALLLQIHPLEESGHAALALPGAAPDEIESSVAFLEAARLQQKYGNSLHVRLDLLDRQFVAARPERVLAAPIADAGSRPLSALVSPLIVEPDGTVVPIHYGLDRRFALGSLHDRPLAALAAEWRIHKMDAFLAVCRDAFNDLMRPSDLPFVNWYTMLAQRTEAAVFTDTGSPPSTAGGLQSA
jgi:MoaA/NifB/PqqE/SkfB family radical SAM enzyme